MECKICGEQESFLYWITRGGWCACCYVEYGMRINYCPNTKEDDRRITKSKKAVDKYLRRLRMNLNQKTR